MQKVFAGLLEPHPRRYLPALHASQGNQRRENNVHAQMYWWCLREGQQVRCVLPPSQLICITGRCSCRTLLFLPRVPALGATAAAPPLLFLPKSSPFPGRGRLLLNIPTPSSLPMAVCEAGYGLAPNSPTGPCKMCANGYFNPTQGTICKACPPGQVSNAARTACELKCPKGQVPSDDKSMCGKYLPMASLVRHGALLTGPTCCLTWACPSLLPILQAPSVTLH